MPSPPPVPERYELSELLGEGGMGQVWAGRDRVLDLPVAIKLVHPRLARRPDFLARFRREVALQASLDHPHLVPLHDASRPGEEPPFVAMALADRGSLADFLPGGLPWPELHRLLDEVLDALAALHARGVLHLDLKPENVLLHGGLDGQAHAWLADLGVARLLDELGDLPGHRAEGTPAYMAPEQLEGRGAELGRATDLYALGAVMAELVGRHPVPAGLDELLDSLLHPEPACRPRLAADLRAALCTLGPPLAPLSPRHRPEGGRSTWHSHLAPARPAQRGDPPPPCRPPEPSRGELPPEPPPSSEGSPRLRASLGLYAHREPPIVGRSAELRRLWELARELRATGRPGVALVVGERGAGKSRLVATVARALEEGGWAEVSWLRYREPPGPRDGFLGAALQLLHPCSGPPEEARARLVRRFQALLPELPPAPMAEVALTLCGADERARQALARQLLHWLLHARCRRGLAVLVMDDVHAARQPGEGLDAAAELLNEAALGQPAPILALCTLSAEALAHDPALAQRVELLEASGATRIELRRLDLEETRLLLDRSLALVPDLRDALARRCAGNPLLARQLLLHWAERDMLVEVGGRAYALAPGIDPERALPRDAAELALRRVALAARASSAPGRFLRALAILALAGAEFPRALLSRVAGPLEGEILASGLVLAAEDHARFDHPVLRDALAEAARKRSDRRSLHLELARAWEGLEAPGQPVRLPRALALLGAGRAAEAFPALAEAAGEAWEAGQAARARELGEAAIAALRAGGGSPAGSARLLTVAARAHHELLELERAGELARLALEAARNPAERAEALLVLGTLAASRAEAEVAEQRLAQASRMARAAGEPGLRLQAELERARVELRHCSPATALATLRSLARGLPAALRPTYQRELARVLHRLGRFEAARRAARLGLRGSNPRALERAQTLHVLALSLWELGRREEAREHARSALQLLRSARTWPQAPATLLLRAELHRLLANEERAREFLHLADRWAQLRGLPAEAREAALRLAAMEPEWISPGSTGALPGVPGIPLLDRLSLLLRALEQLRAGQREACARLFERARELAPRAGWDRDAAELEARLSSLGPDGCA